MTTIHEHLQTLWEHNRQFFGCVPRKIQIQRAGSHYKFRYAGERDSCFVADLKDAAKRLKIFEGIRT